MKIESRESLMKEIATEYWQLDLDFDNGFLTSLKEVLLYTKVNSIAQSQVIKHPEFLISDEKTFILNSGIAITADKLESVYLHKGNHRDLSLSLRFIDSQTECRFEFNVSDTEHLDLLLSSVKSTCNELLTRADPTSGLTCPCCLEKQNEIRLTPQLHPLFTVLDSMASATMKVTLKLTTEELDIYTLYELQYSQNLFYIDAIVSINHQNDGILSIDLAKIHSVTMAARKHDNLDSIQFCLFDSFANLVCEIIIHDISYFTQWKNFLFSDQ